MTSVSITTGDRVMTIGMNRPERLNALNETMIDALHDALQQALADPAIGAIILTGTGDRAFCVGQDLQETDDLTMPVARAVVERLQDISRLILYGTKPVIAAVNGWAIGGGFELAMNCDLSIWSTTAGAALPEISLGLGVSGASTWLLPRIVGWQKANALFLLGEKLTAEALFDMGLAHQVVPPDRLLAEALSHAVRLASLPAASVAGFKQSRIAIDRAEIEAALSAETDNLVERICDPATQQRIKAFIASRH